jgi:hypothetical protein
MSLHAVPSIPSHPAAFGAGQLAEWRGDFHVALEGKR